MSLLTRIFLVVTILAGIGAIVLGMKLKEEKVAHLGTIADQKTQIANLEASLAKEKAEKEKKIAELKKTQGELDDAKSEIEKNKATIAANEAKIKETEDKLASTNAELDQEKAKIKTVLDALPPGISPDQIGPKIKELQEKVTTYEQEKNVLAEQLKTLEAEKKLLQQMVRTKQTGELPDGIEGRVMAVNDDWNFVVLDIGEKQGLVGGARMVVYRGNNLIGRIKIASVEPTVAVADILPEWKQARIQEGDIVAPAR
jgi:peptidoglycan hydrolase CwlO-like protein